jgi:putative chitinase
MPRYGIDTPNEEASFLATVAYESREFTRLEEYLNYSAARLVAVWRNRFYLGEPVEGKRDADEYANAPEKLAEFVYGGRLGNAREGAGDGWKFRGRGPGQLTGRNNYERAQHETGHLVALDPTLMFDPVVGSDVTCWKWKADGFDKIDDDASIADETRKWQGGTEGLARRQKIMDDLLVALGG